MNQFKPVGKIEKVHDALRVDLPSWKLGTLVIAADDVVKVLSGRPVDVSFVQERGEDVFVGFAGTARPSRSGKAINIRIEARILSVPVAAVQAVVSGRRASAQLSSPAPVIDADAAQARPIDAGLCREGF
jgi:hypothetical protein